jgi:hypothetical protein
MAKRRKSAGAAGRSNRRALPFLILLVFLSGAAGYWFANRKQPAQEPHTDTVQVSVPVPGNNDVNLQQKSVPIDPHQDPIKQAVEKQLATADGKAHSAFPVGTKLVSLNVKDGTAILELSPEFKAINKGGDTGESLAYDALRKVLAQFATVKYMRVMVDGKVFEGEHSGAWAEIEVRDGNARVEEKS